MTLELLHPPKRTHIKASICNETLTKNFKEIILSDNFGYDFLVDTLEYGSPCSICLSIPQHMVFKQSIKKKKHI